MKLFSFICFLSFDVYMKKQLIEKLIDEIKADGFRQDQRMKIKVKHFIEIV